MFTYIFPDFCHIFIYNFSQMSVGDGDHIRYRNNNQKITFIVSLFNLFNGELVPSFQKIRCENCALLFPLVFQKQPQFFTTFLFRFFSSLPPSPSLPSPFSRVEGSSAVFLGDRTTDAFLTSCLISMLLVYLSLAACTIWMKVSWSHWSHVLASSYKQEIEFLKLLWLDYRLQVMPLSLILSQVIPMYFHQSGRIFLKPFCKASKTQKLL